MISGYFLTTCINIRSRMFPPASIKADVAFRAVCHMPSSKFVLYIMTDCDVECGSVSEMSFRSHRDYKLTQ
mgnify:CR=1 FL=1